MKTLNEIIQSKRKRKFTNRDDEIRLFTSLIELSLPEFNILSIYGVGGIGKSTLLDEFQGICAQKSVTHLRIDGKIHQSIIKLSHGVRQQLSGSLWRNYFKQFDRHLVKFLEIQGIIEKNTVAKDAIQQILSAGIALDPTGISGKFGKEVINTSLSLITSVIKKTDIDFYIQSEQILAQSLVAGLTKMTTPKLVIFVDTYEQFPEDVRVWFEQMFVPELNENTIIVISGRERLDGNWVDWESNGLIKQIELLNFSKNSTLTMLANAGVSENAIFDEVFDFTQGHPLCISLVAEIGIAPEQKYIISSTLIERILNQVKDVNLLDFLEVLSVPRFCNDELVNLMLPNRSFSTSKIKKYSFVRWHEKGFSLHDLIRNYYNTRMRSQSPERWFELNKKAASYYRKLLDDNPEFSSKWIETSVEIIYHEFALSEKDATGMCVEMFALAETSFNVQFAREILQAIDEIQFIDLQLARWRMLLQAKYIHMIRDWSKAFRSYHDLLVSETDSKLVLILLNGLAIVSSQMNNIEKSLDYAKRALDLAKKLAMRDEVFDALDAIGKSLHRQGRFTEAISLLNSYVEKTEDRGMAVLWERLGLLYLAGGDLGESMKCYERAGSIWSKLGNNWKSTLVQYGKSCVLCEEQKWEEAETVLLPALKRLEDFGDNDGVAKSLSRLARIKIGKKEHEQAIILCNRSSEIYHDMGDDFGWALSQNILALAYRHLGDSDSALKCYKISLRINHRSGNHERMIATLLNIARVLMELDNKKLALNNARAAYMLVKRLDLPKLKHDAEKLIHDISLNQ